MSAALVRLRKNRRLSIEPRIQDLVAICYSDPKTVSYVHGLL